MLKTTTFIVRVVYDDRTTMRQEWTRNALARVHIVVVPYRTCEQSFIVTDLLKSTKPRWTETRNTAQRVVSATRRVKELRQQYAHSLLGTGTSQKTPG